jgi:hypothetical protein
VSEPSTLHRKLAEVMSEVGYIPKRGYNDRQDYQYVLDADVADKVRDSLAKKGITMLPVDIDLIDIRRSVTDKQDVMTLRMIWRFTDSETGDFIHVQSYGSGADQNDKHAYKAITGARKYALLSSFLIPTGDDPEAGNDGEPRTSGGTAAVAHPVDPGAPRPALATPEEKKAYGRKADGLGLTKDQKYAFVALVCQKPTDELTSDDVKLLITKLDEPGLVDMIKDVEKVS